MKRKGPSDPKPLGDLLQTLVAGRGWHDKMALGELRRAWPQIVGEHVSARSRPIALSRGTLTVRAEGGAWAAELTLLGTALAAKADAFLGGDGRVARVTVTGGSTGSSGGGARSPSRGS
jgi:predicted nucleic acid-binding Zn ribbon protein